MIDDDDRRYLRDYPNPRNNNLAQVQVALAPIAPAPEVQTLTLSSIFKGTIYERCSHACI